MLGYWVTDKIQAPPHNIKGAICSGMSVIWWWDHEAIWARGTHQWAKQWEVVGRTWGLVQKSFHLLEHAGYFSCWDAADHWWALAAVLGGKIASLWLCALLSCNLCPHWAWAQALMFGFHSRQGTITLKLGVTQSSFLSGISDFPSWCNIYDFEINHRAWLSHSVFSCVERKMPFLLTVKQTFTFIKAERCGHATFIPV